MAEKLLSKLLSEAEVEIVSSRGPDVLVTGVERDSRNVKPGNLFIAQAGLSADGHNYINAAKENGVVAVAGEKSPDEVDSDLPYVQLKPSLDNFSYLSASYYDFPGRKLTVIGVTGTDGKTTTSNLLFSILKAAGIKAGMVTTVNALIGDQVVDTGFHVTTPEASDVQRYMAQMVDAGLTHVILESTSHGLAQGRVTACEYDIGVVTNITHEHLDY
ncbi:MAG TPA: Mur ligase family protein, partial [Bellilinea sp.]|nr:Mur ligase family protein [Bellilinea sp.]